MSLHVFLLYDPNHRDHTYLAERDGTLCEVLERFPDRLADIDLGPMYRIRFEDGEEDNAFETELTPA